MILGFNLSCFSAYYNRAIDRTKTQVHQCGNKSERGVSLSWCSTIGSSYQSLLAACTMVNALGQKRYVSKLICLVLRRFWHEHRSGYIIIDDTIHVTWSSLLCTCELSLL